MGFDLDEVCRYNRMRSLVREELKRWVGPKLLNTIMMEVIVFRHLTVSEVKEIADVMLKGVFERFKANGIQLHVSERFRERVVEEGYNAWPLKRAVREDSMAEKMVAREIKEGDSVTADVDSGGNVMVLSSAL
ncbi:hypothetical protein V6N13_068878 [Hibiscus sabdariffa]|uniref:Clp ATPase C-terminal domain-containing protein n=1 Tax=Hibiscus sabdariffa TaxID=183260 RepID=A0ABR2QP95_9ROSI